MGIAGSLANIIQETTFHFADTVNIRAKADLGQKTLSTTSLVNKIWAKEGLFGFGKGFSACVYGSAVGGFLYFTSYKAFKGLF